MSWTYDEQLATNRDRVRFLSGDTDSTHPLLQDGEIDYLETLYGTPMLTAAWVCRAIAARFARRVHEEVGDLKLYNDQMYKQYTALADTLEARARVHAVPSAGGVYTADKEAAASNDALVQPAITRGMHDYS